MIKEESIERVRGISISDIVGQYVTLQKGKACCPFHNEKTPSFGVKESEGFYKCFGCGASGDGIAFVMEMEKLDFYETVERLAGQYNIPLEYTKERDNEGYQKARDTRKSLRSLLQYAGGVFSDALAKNKAAYEYVTAKRGYNDNIINKWGIGYAPDSWSTLTTHFRDSGKLPQAVDCCLVREGEKNHYDFLRNRITFALHNEHGELVGFSGRVLEGKEQKYMNPINNLLYQKPKFLYGLHHAKRAIQKAGYVILVEGYTDVISMHEMGEVEHVVGISGTALTDEHCKVLKRYTDNVLILPDGDEAGLNSVEKMLGLFIRHGLTPKVFANEWSADPDDLVRLYREKWEVVDE